MIARNDMNDADYARYTLGYGHISDYAKNEGTLRREPTSNRCPEWWTPPQPRREKRPLSVRLWQAERRAAKKTTRTNERRERRTRA